MVEQGKCSLQLGGGGARAAYQVGVLQAIAELFPRNHGLPFPILCGTSAGAINATALACYASCFHLGVRKLDYVWRHFKTEQVYRSDFRGLSRHLLSVLLKRGHRPPSLFDNRPLQKLLSDIIPLHRIEQHISSNKLHALTVSASRYYHPCSVNFFQGNSNIMPWQRSRRFGQHSRITIEHLMASAAIPMVFPSTRIGDDHYGDGSILQMAPLSPPIHLGADKILIINLDSPHRSRPLAQRRRAPDSSELAGHLLDTVFSDTLNSDLERLERINRSVKLLPDKLRSSQPLKVIETLVIKPSADLDEIARHHYRHLPRSVRYLLRTIGVGDDSDSSLLSYLMFEGPYCRELMHLGRQDAYRQKVQLQQLLGLTC